MKVNDYGLMVATLLKNPELIKHELSAKSANLLHVAVGIAGEAGEILELAKKVVINSHQPNPEKFLAELGDIEFYLEAMRQHFGFTRDQVLQANIDKLQHRYDGVYSDRASVARIDMMVEK